MLAALLVAAALTLPQPGSVAWPEGKAAAFYLSFDDGCPSHPRNVFPLLAEYKVPATFYVCPGWDSFKADASLWATENPYVFLGNHTQTHGGIKTIDDFRREVTACNDAIRALPRGKGRAIAFGIPGTETMAKLLPSASEAEIAAVFADAHLVERYPYHGYPVACKTVDEALAYIDRVIAEGGVGHLDFHGIGGDWLDPGVDYLTAVLKKLDANRERLWLTDLATLRAYVDAATSS